MPPGLEEMLLNLPDLKVCCPFLFIVLTPNLISHLHFNFNLMDFWLNLGVSIGT